MTPLRRRPGVTLVELLLFVGLMAVASGAILGFLFLTTDARERQRVRANVQQVAVQLQQALSYDIRTSERVLWPALQGSGTALALQTPASGASPAVVSVVSGSLVIVRGSTLAFLTPATVEVTSFWVENVSPRADRPSVVLHIALEERVPLPQEEVASAAFDLAVAPLPTDSPVGDACGCAPPSCGGGTLTWETCLGTSCETVDFLPIGCP